LKPIEPSKANAYSLVNILFPDRARSKVQSLNLHALFAITCELQWIVYLF